MNHERQMPKVKLILMSSKQQMTHEELLEEVQSIYSTDTPEFWNEITDDELWQMKNEAEREEIIGADFEEFDFGITVLRSKEQLLASIDNAKMRYQMEAQQEQPPHTQAFYRNVEHLLSKFHGKVETTAKVRSLVVLCLYYEYFRHYSLSLPCKVGSYRVRLQLSH